MKKKILKSMLFGVLPGLYNGRIIKGKDFCMLMSKTAFSLIWN